MIDVIFSREICKIYYEGDVTDMTVINVRPATLRKGVVLEGLADGYRGTEQLNG